ncbi:hypothetical protein Ocin01_05558 [Orchesella cincta]|uniref:DUF243 domain-containing protein n=1 Tax=Orchesella cincta TaxID=48709 RepID=A0A1D2N777_ORCCI|nr:hypothetical protein Ocin01_05558 [Orchesella cincta]
MISEALVLASCMMLATAQFQLQTHQYQPLIPNVQPFQFTSMPNSELLMTHHANTIMNQDTSIPISPGPLSGAPVLVSEATQNVLDQEPRIVGYNVPIQLVVPQQQQLATSYFQSPQQQQLIPIFQTGYSANSAGGQPQAQPQTISFPVINIAPQQQQQQQPLNVVPVQAVASLKSVIEDSKVKQAPPIKTTKYRSHYTKPSYNQLKTEQRPTKTRSSPRPRSQVYQDIPHNHPLPAPLVHKKAPSNHQNDGSRFQESRTNSDFSAPSRERESDIEGLIPPLPPRNRQHSRSQQPSASASENFAAQNHNSRRNHRSNEKKRIPSAHDELLEVVKEAPRDSSPQPSDNFYQQAPTVNNENYGGQSSYSSYSAPNNGGYSSHSDSVVHKHIFVHAAATESYDEQPKVKVVRPAPPPERHVQVIFVKAPAPRPQEQTVVELPENPPLKTIVYVLAKNQEGNNDVKIVRPPPTKPPAPEIYFIRYGQRYGDKNSNQGYPVPNLQSLYDNYGSHSQPAETPYKTGSPLRSKRNHDGLSIYAPLMSYSTSGQINEITQEEAEFRRTNVDAFFK